MRKFKGAQAPRSGLSGGEKVRLGLMLVGIIVIGASLFYANAPRGEGQAVVAEPVEIVARVELPTIPVDALRAGVEDSTPAQRVRLERAPVATLLGLARQLTPAHFEALDARALDAATIEEIRADPNPWRGRAVTVRGQVLVHKELRPDALAAPEHHLTLAVEGGGTAHAVVLSAPTPLEPGDWLRLSGLFLKLYSNEGPAGEWIEAPLVVSSRAEPSVAPIGPRPYHDPDRLDLVIDDGLQRPLGLDVPGRFELLAHARDAAPDAHDFSAALELDRDLLGRILEDPQPYRGAAFRLGTSRIEVVRHLALPENGARLDTVTELWIANTGWDRALPVIGVQVPGRLAGLAKGQLIKGELQFFKNYAFDSGVGTRRVAPFFVGHSIERFEVPTNPVMRQVLYAVAILTGLMVTILAVLVRRDRRRAEVFERQQVERRQRRRTSDPAAGLAEGR